MYDDHIVLHREITNELHLLKLSESIRLDPGLHRKLFFTGSLVPPPQWFWYGHNY